MDSLFDEPSPVDRDKLAANLARLAREHIYIGGSSWKYEGWIGQVYSRSRYLSRGRFSKKLFEATCLEEYAATFPAVCGDFAFYQFPTEEFWKRLFAQVPDGFQFAFKIPEQITCKLFPLHARYGAQGGRENESFLDVELLKASFLRPLWRHRAKASVLIFEFGSFARNTFAGVSEFLARLDPFLAALPREFRYAVEIRNPEFLEPDYFQCLRSHGVAHVFNAWSRMPELRYQIALPESITADFIVSRALLRHGRSYEEAVKLLSPYTEVRDLNPEVRTSLRDLIQIARDRRMVAFLFVNNRLEGSAPATMLAISEP
ncbi:MAG: DUF72 domain-containing protein [Candidatus Solibacter usitatus]|nr:DUF72 domain-containing protein [Candidatus Solibacter usitatus]